MMRWRCWSATNLLDLYADGRLTSGTEARVRSHLEACADCRARAEELAPVDAGAPVEVPEGFAEALLERLRREGAAPAREAARWTPRWSPAQALALLYFAAIALAHALPGVPSQAYAEPPRGEEASP